MAPKPPKPQDKPQIRGKRPQYKMISVAKLHASAPYQIERKDKPEFQRWLGRTIPLFDWALFGVLNVTDMGDGYYEIWDGQGRHALAIAVGINEVPCLVDHNVDEKVRANHFRGQRNRRTVNRVEDHVALVVEEDQQALDIEAALTAHGLKLSGKRGAKSVGAVAAVYQVQKTSEEYGLPSLLSDVFTVCEKTWGSEVERFDASVLIGVSEVFLYTTSPSAKEAAEVFSQHTDTHLAARLVGLAKILKAKKGRTGYNTGPEVAEYLKKSYNSVIQDSKQKLRKQIAKP